MIKAKRPELITITLDQNASEHEITTLIKNLEATSVVFRYVCGYRGKVVDMKDKIEAENEENNLTWGNT